MLLASPYSKLAARYICAVGLLICFAQYTWARPPADVNIVAHHDDDILFMNPDILNAVVAGHRQVTVYITSGSRDGTEHAKNREKGAIAGYQKLLDLADIIRNDRRHFKDFTETFEGDSRVPGGYCPSPSPTPDVCFPCTEHNSELSTPGTASVCSPTPCPLHIGSRDLAVVDIGDAPGGGPWVRLIFLRVQQSCAVDGRCQGNQVDLGILFTSPGNNTQIISDFNNPNDPNYTPTPPYTKQDLINQLVDILGFVQPNKVRTQDPADGHTVDYNNGIPGEQIPNLACRYHPDYVNPQFYDHTDHVWGARFAREAIRRYDHLPNQPNYFTYKGYNLEWNENPRTRVSTKDFCLKKSIMNQYAIFDDEITSPGFDCFNYWYIGYQKGQQQQSP